MKGLGHAVSTIGPQEGKGWKSLFLAFNFKNNVGTATFVYY